MSNPESTDEAGRKRKSIFVLPAWLPPVATAILGGAAVAWLAWIAPDNTLWTYPARVVILTLGAAIVLILCLGIFCLRLWLHNRTREAFGVLWNRRGNPICSKCDGPLTKNSSAVLLCPACKIQYPLYDLIDGGPIMVWDAYRIMARAQKQPPAPQEPALTYPELTEIKTKILSLLAKQKDITVNNIAEEMNISPDVAKLQIDELFDDHFVEWTTERTYRDTVWRLANKGVGYLFERGLHK